MHTNLNDCPCVRAPLRASHLAGRAPLNTDLLLSTGAIEGPYRRCRPVTTLRVRAVRALREFFYLKGPL